MPATAALQSIQSISDITTQVRHTIGDVPPPLVGASVTVINGHAYVFAGRLVSSRKMTNSLYILNLNTLEWTRHNPPPDAQKPANPRYFHSAEAYNNRIVIFGGMGHSSDDKDGLCVLDDISVFNVDTMEWKHFQLEPSLYSPRPRYAHLASIVQKKMVIVGGQDMSNSYITEINVFDLEAWSWISVKQFDKHVGAYRSIAVATPTGSGIPVMAVCPEEANGLTANSTDSDQSGAIAAGSIYLYSNYNFAEVRRELQLVVSPENNSSPIQDFSSNMTGSVMPPGLRFPNGHILGQHLILTGTYLTPQTHAFSVWLMNLSSMTWSRVETGSILSNGSWNRAILNSEHNKLMVFGNRNRDLLTDYNHRQVNYDHIAIVDMEAFGAYHLPAPTCSPLAQEMGLSLLNEPGVSDFSIVTRENAVIPINSAILRRRWPYFENIMRNNVEMTSFKHPPQPTIVVGGKEIGKENSPQQVEHTLEAEENEKEEEKEKDDEAVETAEPDEPGTSEVIPPQTEGVTETSEETPASQDHGIVEEATLKYHALHFPHSSQVIIAFLQFIYTDNLLTAQQHQPQILSQLLLLADMYNLPRLKALATHALHQMLNMSTAALIFETAALSHQISLQVRALKMMIAAKKLIQQQQSRGSMSLSPRPSIHCASGPSGSATNLANLAESTSPPGNSPRSLTSSSSFMSGTVPSSQLSRTPVFDSNSRMSILEHGHYMPNSTQPGSPNGSVRSRTTSGTRPPSTRRSVSSNGPNTSPFAFSQPVNPLIPEQDDLESNVEPRSSNSTQRPTDPTDDSAAPGSSSKEDAPTKKFMSLKKSKKNSNSDGKDKKPFLEAFSNKLASFAH
ncbi:hypothetical protein VKS41_004057 [Umbelopsis sp. WA50703]